MQLKIKKIDTNAKMPTKGSEYSAGYDLYVASTYDIMIHPNETAKLGTGLTMEIPEGYFGAIFARSGIATKQGLRPANCVGVIDSDYRGEIIVALHNDSDEDQLVTVGSRIAQLIIMPYLNVTIEEVTKLNSTERGEKGFGSTGIK